MYQVCIYSTFNLNNKVEQSFNCTQLTAHLTIVTSDVYKVSAVADTFLLKSSIISLDLASS